ncbi:MAG: pyridoxal phosphate-dependent aminotransferase family protein [Candidatus Marinimicrobia bacterium]|nr:pyridoxal phosphate-dependent aminotransferase family protein [Candidatus Neomarinimicrobiota bacterium]
MMSIPVLQPSDHVCVMWEGKKYLFFGGYDYHRLSGNPDILRATQDALFRYGLNCGGSRITTGNHPLHIRLEARISGFLGTNSTALLPAGYMANLALFELLGTKDVICYYHPQSHPSLKAAVKISGLPAFEIPDSREQFDALIRKGAKKPLIVTDGVYDHLPPLPEYHALAEKHEGVLLIDEAHALGILGKHGRGAFEHFDLDTGRLLLTGSLSKACGTSGGFVAGPSQCIEKLRSTCTYATTSAPSLPMTAAGIASFDFLSGHSRLIRDFQKRCLKIKQRVRDMGYNIPVIPTPVISICFQHKKDAAVLRDELVKAGIYPPLISYPGKSDYFRFALSSAHADKDIERLLDVLEKCHSIREQY